jgi:hypothetical protein
MATVNAAADANDANDIIVSAFGASSKEINKFSKNAADKLGMSAAAYEMMAGKTGQALTGLGINQQDAARQTTVLAQRAADMAAIWGGTTEEAMAAITKGVQGQTKGLKKFGVSIDKNAVKARALAEGYKDASGKVTTAGMAIASQELILEATSKYQGEFAKNSGDLGSQQDILKAKFEDLQVTIGNKLLPIMLKLFEIVVPLVDFVSANIDWLAPLTAGILALVAGIKIWTIAQTLLNSQLLLTAGPIVLVVAAIAALVAGIIWAYNNVTWFHDAVDAMGRALVAAFVWVKDAAVTAFNWISDNWPLLLAIITGPFGLAVYAIKQNWDSIVAGAKWCVDNIGWFFGMVYDILTWPFIRAWGYIKQVYEWMLTGVKWMVDNIKWLFSSLADFITYPFRKAFEEIKWLWNSTLGGFGFTVPSWIPFIGGKDFRIPEMAQGGIVNRPTIALLGEAGREAVIPLDSSGGLQVQSPASVTLNVYALTANSEVGRQVYNALRDYERTSGNSIFASTAIPKGF